MPQRSPALLVFPEVREALFLGEVVAGFFKAYFFDHYDAHNLTVDPITSMLCDTGLIFWLGRAVQTSRPSIVSGLVLQRARYAVPMIDPTRDYNAVLKPNQVG